MTSPSAAEADEVSGHTSLGQHAVSGARWAALGKGGQQIVQVASALVLARLLSPDDFGLYGMLTVVLGLVLVFRDLGVGAYVVRWRDPDPASLCGLFWVNTAVSLGLSLLMVAMSPLLGALYRDSRITPLFAASSLGLLGAGLGVVPQALLLKGLRYRSIAIAEFIGVVAGAVAAVTCALAGLGAWSLVVQSAFMAIITSAAMFLYARWMPRLPWSASYRGLRTALGFSANVVGYGVSNHLMQSWDYLVMGRVLGASAVGPYALAYKYILYPLRNIGGVVYRVMYPALARMSDETERMLSAYVRVLTTVAVFTFPIVIGLAAVSNEFVEVVLGSKWMEAAPLIVALTPLGLVQSLLPSVREGYQALGQTRQLMRFGVTYALLMLVAVLIGVRDGAIGVAVASSVVATIMVVPAFSGLMNTMGGSLSDLGKPIMPVLLAALGAGGAVLLAARLLGVGNPAVRLALLSLLGVGTYLVLLRVACPAQWADAQSVLRGAGVRGA